MPDRRSPRREPSVYREGSTQSLGRTVAEDVRTRVQRLSSAHSKARPTASVTTPLPSSLIDIHKPMCHQLTLELGSGTHSMSDLELGLTAFVRSAIGTGRVLGRVALRNLLDRGSAMNLRFVEQTVVWIHAFERPMSQCPDARFEFRSRVLVSSAALAAVSVPAAVAAGVGSTSLGSAARVRAVGEGYVVGGLRYCGAGADHAVVTGRQRPAARQAGGANVVAGAATGVAPTADNPTLGPSGMGGSLHESAGALVMAAC